MLIFRLKAQHYYLCIIPLLEFRICEANIYIYISDSSTHKGIINIPPKLNKRNVKLVKEVSDVTYKYKCEELMPQSLIYGIKTMHIEFN